MGVEPTNDTAATSGCSRSASTASLSPWTTLKTPSGRPASAHSSARTIAAEGSRSLGLRTNVLPQAIATGNIHIGTIAGKLNGVMPTQTPSGSRNEYRSTPVETCAEKSPFSSCGMPHANSTTSSPRCTSPARVAEHLAVLVGDRLGDPPDVGVDQLAEGEQHLGALAQRRLRPLLERLAGRTVPRRRRRRGRPAPPRPAAHPWRGSRSGRAGCPRRSRSPCRRPSARWSSSLSPSVGLDAGLVGRAQVAALS